MTADSIVPITSRAEFHDAIRDVVRARRAGGAREILHGRSDFADWPLNDARGHRHARGWVDSQPQPDGVRAQLRRVRGRHSRLVDWRRQWAHVVHCRSDPELEAEQMPTILLAPGTICVRLLDRVRHRGTVSESAGRSERVQGSR